MLILLTCLIRQNCYIPKVLSCHVRRIHSSSVHLWRVMFFGTDDFSLVCLRRLNEELKSERSISQLEIVTSKWEKNPVRLYGKKEDLRVHEWPISRSVVKNFDIGLVASFGHLLPQAIISAFPLGMLNIHGSILPRWRGAAPVVYTVMHGDCEGGITIMRIQPFKFDEGEIISTKKTYVPQTETSTNLRKRLACLGTEELIRVIQKLPGILETAVPQCQEGITYAPKITPDLGVISFKSMSAVEVYNRYRALCDILPLKSSWMGLSLRLHDVSLHDTSLLNCNSNTCDDSSILPATHLKETELQRPGQVTYNKRSKTLLVQCMNGAWVKIGRLAVSKKRFLNSSEFYNGYLSKKPKNTWLFE